MDNKPQHATFIGLGLVMAFLGWAGLALVVQYTLPTLGPRWLFFALLVLALSGTSLPVVYFLHIRFPSTPPVEGDVVLRQSIWFGVYGGILAWLQMGRVLSLVLGLVLLGIFILIEALLRIWERSRWKPK
ncbi:MAG TPA: hypothetical protein PKW33_03680 [Anaerolineaceae bacterium]|nr:hypothetical protein [Anaerolineaceae bacterium]HPN50662.1 hypothetical protein [Anaerolineaceae bacterium]